MSLINKMLKDLDARATGGAGNAADMFAKPVARQDARTRPGLIAAAAAGVLVLSVGGVLAWRHFHQPAPAPAPVGKPVQVVTTGPRPLTGTPLPAASAPDAPAPAGQEPEPAEEPPEQAAPAAAAPARPQAKPRDQAGPAGVKPLPPKAAPAPRLKERPLTAERMMGREENAGQKAEAAYSKALASLQEGWVSEAIATLEQALQANPRHEAARQTLVSLLMENKRYDDAMRHLHAALVADPRQPALAMLLARLQIERGGSGIETLTRTLPHASGNGEYHAFLAGALQRQGRNTEAAAQYQAALRSAPHNAVWWMGLGMSLQGDKREAEALEAFRRAKANGLSPELQSFVDGKIQQLSR